MLSGIGPETELKRHGIQPRVVLDGVGRHLQDRYEVGVVNRMTFDTWKVYRGARFGPGDRLLRQWRRARRGVYTTNGAVLTVFSPLVEGCCRPRSLLHGPAGAFPSYRPDPARQSPAIELLTWWS